MGIVSEFQDKNNSNAQGRSQVPPKRKLDDCDAALLSSSFELSSQINKRTRRSSRFTTEIIGDKPVPSITSSRLSGTFEIRLGLCDAKQVTGTEKLVHISEGHGLVSSKQELLNYPTGCLKTTVNGSRVKSLGNASGVHTNSLKISGNGTSNGLVTASDADNGVTGEMHADATVIYLSDDDEEPQDVQDSVEFLYTTSSDGDVLMQDASGSTLSSGENGRRAPLDQNTPIKSTKGKGTRVTRIAVREKHEHGSCFFIGVPIPCEEAKERWRWRYDLKVVSSVSLYFTTLVFIRNLHSLMVFT